jgi:hypothetical protein
LLRETKSGTLNLIFWIDSRLPIAAMRMPAGKSIDMRQG